MNTNSVRLADGSGFILHQYRCDVRFDGFVVTKVTLRMEAKQTG